MSSDSDHVFALAEEVASKAGSGFEVVLLPNPNGKPGFMLRPIPDAQKPEQVQQAAQLEQVQVQVQPQQAQQPVPEVTHYSPQFVQPQVQYPQNQAMNPLMGLMMNMLAQGGQVPQGQYFQYPQQFQQGQYYPQQFQQGQYYPQQPKPVQYVPQTVPQQAQPQQVQVQQSPREEASQVVKSAPVKVVKSAPVKAVKPEPAKETEAAPAKGRWAEVAIKGAGKAAAPVASRTLPPTGAAVRPRKEKRKDVSGVQIPEGYKPEEGKVTGNNLWKNWGENSSIWICTVQHTKGECAGTEEWVHCRNIYGDEIEEGVGPFANKGAHANAVGETPTTADFCKRTVDDKPACDIHSCTDPKCRANHVAYFETDKEKLRAIKRPIRKERHDRSRGRSRAINADGERPEMTTLGDYVAGLEVDEGSDNLAASVAGLQKSPPHAIIRRSIDGVPSEIAEKKDSE